MIHSEFTRFWTDAKVLICGNCIQYDCWPSAEITGGEKKTTTCDADTLHSVYAAHGCQYAPLRSTGVYLPTEEPNGKHWHSVTDDSHQWVVLKLRTGTKCLWANFWKFQNSRHALAHRRWTRSSIKLQSHFHEDVPHWHATVWVSLCHRSHASVSQATVSPTIFHSLSVSSPFFGLFVFLAPWLRLTLFLSLSMPCFLFSSMPVFIFHSLTLTIPVSFCLSYCCL